MHTSNDDASSSLLKAYGRSPQSGLRPTLKSPCVAGGKTHDSVVKFTKKCPPRSPSGAFAFLRGECFAVCAPWRDTGRPFAPVLRRVWWIPLKCFSSCCFCSFPAHFTHWQARLCFRWEGEWVWQDCGWALSTRVGIQLAGQGRMPAYPPPFLWMCTSRWDWN